MAVSGPWKASVEQRPFPASGHWYVVTDEEENGLGEFYGDDHETNVANLHMAAAAPDLFDALDAIQRLADGDDGIPPHVLIGLHHKARAALAKARGES